jgi:hypothetical protein
MAYWSRQGRESIDAVVLFGALLSIGTWGAPLFRWAISTEHAERERFDERK